MGGLRAGVYRRRGRQAIFRMATAAERANGAGVRGACRPLPRCRQRRSVAARGGTAHRHRRNRRHPGRNPLGLRLPGESAGSGRGQSGPRIRLPGRDRSPGRAGLRAQAGPARGASTGPRRAGRRSPLRGHARVRHRSRSVGGLGERRRRLPEAAHDLDSERLGREHRDGGSPRRRALDGEPRCIERRHGRRDRAASPRRRVPRLDRRTARRGERPSGRTTGHRGRTATPRRPRRGQNRAGNCAARVGRGRSRCVPGGEPCRCERAPPTSR